MSVLRGAGISTHSIEWLIRMIIRLVKRGLPRIVGSNGDLVIFVLQ